MSCVRPITLRLPFEAEEGFQSEDVRGGPLEFRVAVARGEEVMARM